MGAERFAEAERLSIALYRFAAAYALERGIIIADTKFEFGVNRDGRLVLGDEALTPDSSRFWPADQYAPGGPQPSYDKQYVRDYCEKIGWGKTYPGPELPPDVVSRHPPALRGRLRAAHRPFVRRLPREPVRRPEVAFFPYPLPYGERAG